MHLCETPTWLEVPSGWKVTGNAIAKSPPMASIARSVKRSEAHALILDLPGGLRSVFVNRSRKFLIADVLEWLHAVIPRLSIREGRGSNSSSHAIARHRSAKPHGSPKVSRAIIDQGNIRPTYGAFRPCS
jgi:hypothetical protein